MSTARPSGERAWASTTRRSRPCLGRTTGTWVGTTRPVILLWPDKGPVYIKTNQTLIPNSPIHPAPPLGPCSPDFSVLSASRSTRTRAGVKVKPRLLSLPRSTRVGSALSSAHRHGVQCAATAKPLRRRFISYPSARPRHGCEHGALELRPAGRRRLELLLPRGPPNPPHPLLFSPDPASSTSTASRLSQVSGSMVGYGLARHAGCAVLNGPTRPENRPIWPCLGRWPGTKPSPARPRRHTTCHDGPTPIGPCLIRARVMPSRAGPMDIYRHSVRTYSKLTTDNNASSFSLELIQFTPSTSQYKFNFLKRSYQIWPGHILRKSAK
jgi:hypothetical protein